MPDSDPDLYSFLRSKDFSSDDADPESGDGSSPSDEHTDDTPSGEDDSSPEAPSVESVGSFADAEPSSSTDGFPYGFDDDALGKELRTLSADTLDQAPFGIVQVDDGGTVKAYNRYESEMSGVDPDDALGRNFFTELAPCSGNRLFHGRFKKGIKRDALDERFTYTFTYKMSPTLVDVRMYRDEANNNWILVRKR